MTKRTSAVGEIDPASNDIPASIAHAVSGLKRQTLNELISLKLYPCAPKALRRLGRVYGLSDVVGLTLLRLLLKAGVKRKTACFLACEAVRQPTATRIRFVSRVSGDTAIMLDDSSPDEPAAVCITNINLIETRKFVQAKLLEAADSGATKGIQPAQEPPGAYCLWGQPDQGHGTDAP